MKKLERLDLITEENSSPQTNGVQGFQYINHHQQQINQRKEQQALQSKTFMLNKFFSGNILETLSSDLKLNYLKKKSSDKEVDDVEGQFERAKFKLERLTHFMLNIDQMQNKENYP